jgi:cyclopropane fatty-acyl-phospholipid synthase-like methyltransferase
MTGKETWENVKSTFGSGSLPLGPRFSYKALHTPRQLLFHYARYKFAARLIGETPGVEVLELGCSEGLNTLMLAEGYHKVIAVDFDEDAIKWAKSNINNDDVTFIYDDFLGKTYGQFDAVVSIDVIEHIAPENEGRFFETVTANLKPDSYCIIGTPNITASQYASEQSRKGHVNLFSAERLRDAVSKYFKNVFTFGMNDEVVHTGFYPMSHYLFVLGCSKR